MLTSSHFDIQLFAIRMDLWKECTDDDLFWMLSVSMWTLRVRGRLVSAIRSIVFSTRRLKHVINISHYLFFHFKYIKHDVLYYLETSLRCFNKCCSSMSWQILILHLSTFFSWTISAQQLRITTQYVTIFDRRQIVQTNVELTM